MTTETRPINNIEVLAGVLTGIVRDHSSRLTMRQMTVLLNVRARKNEPTVRDIAQALGLSKPAISRALDRLNKEGFIERITDPNDQRSILVNILPAGWEMFKILEGIKPQPVPDKETLTQAAEETIKDAAIVAARKLPPEAIDLGEVKSRPVSKKVLKAFGSEAKNTPERGKAKASKAKK